MSTSRFLLGFFIGVAFASAFGTTWASEHLTEGHAAETPVASVALHTAAMNADLATVELLLDRGAEIDARNDSGNTALHLAAFRGSREVVDALIRRGAEVTLKDKGGFAALDWAAANGFQVIVAKLLNAGADVESRDLLGNTALFWAAENGHLDVIDTLLARGADPGSRNSDGETPLHLAAANGELEVCALLLDRGALFDAADNNGETPLQVATAEHYSEIVELFYDSGAGTEALAVPSESSERPETDTTLPPSRATRKSRILDSIRRNGGIVIGYRQAAVPFSYLGPDGVPMGYSIQVCREVVAAIQVALGAEKLPIRWLPVSPESRLRAIDTGEVELDCGITTHTLSRRELAEFSLTTFVTGTKLLVKSDSGVKGIADLDGRKIAVLPATTNAKAVAEAARTADIRFETRSVQDHPAGLRAVAAGEAAAYAGDHILLYALIHEAARPQDFRIVGDFLSYDPYAIGMPRNDSAFKLLVDRTLSRLFRTGAMEKIYGKWFDPLKAPMPQQLKAAFRLQALPE